MRIRYRFSGDLSSAATAVLDPEKLTWVEESHHDLAARTVRFELHPDHYADRFSCRGQLPADRGSAPTTAPRSARRRAT